MVEVPTFVVDSSVVTRWYLQDENLVPQALRIRNDFRQGQVRLVAPGQIVHELGSALLKATWPRVGVGRISVAEAEAAIADFQRFQVELINSDALAPAAFRLARYYASSYWDALFLATAQMTNTRLIHADGNLRRGLRGTFPLELWIGDYQ